MKRMIFLLPETMKREFQLHVEELDNGPTMSAVLRSILCAWMAWRRDEKAKKSQNKKEEAVR